MSDVDSSISFYVELDAGKHDGALDKVYGLLISDGEVFQAAEVVERAIEIAGVDGPSEVWLRRRALRASELKTLDATWLPNRLIPGSQTIHPRPGAVLGMFKSSMPHALAGYTVRTQRTLEAQILAGFRLSLVPRSVLANPVSFENRSARWSIGVLPVPNSPSGHGLSHLSATPSRCLEWPSKNSPKWSTRLPAISDLTWVSWAWLWRVLSRFPLSTRCAVFYPKRGHMTAKLSRSIVKRLGFDGVKK